MIFELTLRLGTHARSQNRVPANNLCPSAAAGWRNIHRKWSGSQKLPKNIFNRCRFPAALWIIDCLQEDSGGRTRARTWDPLIKSQLLYQLSYAPELPLAGEPRQASFA